MSEQTTKRVRLGEVLSVKARIGWQGLTQKEHMLEGKYRLVTGVDFKDGYVDFNKCVYVSRERYEQDPNIQLREGDILLTKDGTIGKVAVVGEMKMPATLNSGVFVLRDLDNHFETRYLYHYFLAPDFRTLVERQLTGCTIPHLNQKILIALQVPKPPLAEQKRIAEVLDKISAMKRNAEARVQKLDLLVKSRFVEMFGDNYPVVSVGDVYHVGGPKRIKQSEWVSDGVPFLKISDLMNRVDGKMAAASSFISAARFNELKSQGQVPKAGDVLVTARGTLGRCYVVRPDDEFYFQDGMITWLSERSSKLDLTYFLAAVQSVEFRKQYQGVSPGSTVAYLSISQLSKLKLPLPPLALQREFAAFVEKVEKLKATAQQECEQVDLLYRAKLQECFG